MVAALMSQMTAVAHALPRTGETEVPSFDEVYAAHAAFVWRVLRTFGVGEAQVEDAVQDVFVVVHRRLREWEGRAAITTWLFEIARRVASSHRRRVGADRTEELVVDPAGPTDTFAAMSRAQAAATVFAILQQLDEDKRTVFALVELEQLSVPEVARMLELNLNTTYSRLRLARAAFELAARAQVKP
ncbi:MAG: sigma-70 family RNA polymerase sigma factor [Myxococcota bacterium]|nr:sigma-70 family RNA polymerase sigma factor [Myxococcota bacterium]